MSARLVIMGPQGSGKGTQATRLADRLGVPAISTGDIFRANVKGGTPLGLQATAIMDAGDLVPDALTNAMVRERLGEPDAAEGFILDGYPRNAAQVDALDAMLTERGHGLDAVLELTADRDELLARLARRSTVEGRTDDTAEVIEKRLAIYTAQTHPLAERYGDRGLLVTVDGIGDVDEVTERLVAALGARVG